MDSFEGVIEFVAVAESQGFSAAAKQLGCSTSHVSRQVSRLEERIGSALLARTTRLVSLTQVGNLYYQQCRDLVVGLQQANEQVNNQQVELNGVLRVSSAGIFAEKHVVPVLIKFAQQHPELSIDMDFNTRRVNFVEDGIDFAIRYGTLSDSGLVARKLLDRPMIAVASRAYLDRKGEPKVPEDLKNHSCIVTNNDHWKFDQEGISYSIKVQGRWRSNNASSVVMACEKGFGIAYMPRTSFLGALQRNTLVPILEPYWSKGVSSWIVYQNRRFLPVRARLAIDYLIDHFSDWHES